jgi:hypothetical protein
MGAVPTTTNATATAVNSAINTAVQAAEIPVTAAIVAELAALTGPMAPVFAWLLNTFLKPLISPIVSYIGSKFSTELQGVGTFVVTDAQTSGEESTLEKDVTQIQADEKAGNASAVAADEKKYETDQSSLIHDDGSAPPST